MNPVVEITGISKSYKDVQALNNISLDIEQGELFGLIGPDGAGKTSLYRILATLLLPDEGHAHMMGLDVVKDYKKIRNIIGYMPGRFSLYQDLSVRENLELFASIFGTTIEKNYDLIKGIYSQLEPFRDRRAGKLSGGMKQKLALSCALIHRPEVLLLDEPTTGVDPVSRKEFWNMLKKLQQKGLTILVSTAYMDEATLCDKIALIQKGELLSVDTPGELISGFDDQIFGIGSLNKFKTLKILQTLPTVQSAYYFGEYIHYIDQRKDLTIVQLENELFALNLEGLNVIKADVTVEDCFIAQMNPEIENE